MTPPSLRQQAEAVALASANLRGHIDNLARLVGRGERPQWELDHCRRQYPALKAAADTLALIAERESIRQAAGGGRAEAT